MKNTNLGQRSTVKYWLKLFWNKVKKLRGEPHYIATGMAIGVFVGITPTIPFHTVIAVAMAFIFKGSKPAAAIGVWIANPITIPILYIGSFKFGTLLLNRQIPFNVKFESINELLSLGLDVTIAMVIGGAILGIVPGIISYIATYKFFTAVRSKILRKRLDE